MKQVLKEDEIINGNTSVQQKRKDQLVAEGWFRDPELILHKYARKLSSNRELVKKTYSFIPLQFMGDYGKNEGLKLIPDRSIPNIELPTILCW
jgi:hypothetical protein